MKRINFLNLGLAVLFLAVAFVGCKKDDDDPVYELKVETGAVSDITATTATAFGTMTYDDKTEILSGICWSTEEMPTIEDNVKQKGVIKGSYECNLTGLSPETTYYYRAFAQHGNKIVYGEQKSFTTIDGDDPGPDPGDGDGSEENPYSVAQAMQNQDSQVAWVKGYIVGGVKNDDEISAITSADDVVFGNTNIRATSVLIADSKDETNYLNCVVVNLPTGAIRAAVNLQSNPDNLGKELQITGTLRMYFGISGVRDVTAYELEGGDDPGPDPGDGDGSEANPYNVIGAISNQTETIAWVKGYIVGGVKNDDAISTITSADDVVFGNTNIRATAVLLADSQTETNYLNCVVVNLPTTGGIRAAVNLQDNPNNLGKELQINGKLRTYFGIAGVRDVTAYKLEGGDDPGPGDVIFSETFATSQGSFIIKNVVKPSEVENVWRHNAQYSQMAAGAYIDGTNYATESWLISPEIDLSQVATAIFTFEHAGKQFNAPVSNLTIQVSTTYSGGDINAADWTALSIPNHLAGETNVFKSAGDINLTPYCGQSKVRVAFKYTSTTSGAGNWYVKNVVVK